METGFGGRQENAKADAPDLNTNSSAFRSFLSTIVARLRDDGRSDDGPGESPARPPKSLFLKARTVRFSRSMAR